MEKTLVINSGSSSIKIQMFENKTEKLVFKGLIENIGNSNSKITIFWNEHKFQQDIKIANHTIGLDKFLEILISEKIIRDLSEIIKIGHRIVQGGEFFHKSTIIKQEELQKIKQLADLAPLHNIPNAKGIEVCQKLLPDAINIGVFDTEYHSTLPESSYRYAIPEEWYSRYNVRKYGMHGISYKYVVNKIAEIKNIDVNEVNTIICHLGNGSSITAVQNGKSIQTSMGLTPLQGLVMGTRSGDIDPAIYEYINFKTELSLNNITDILNTESGLLGLSGLSNDFRILLDAIKVGNKRAKLALDVFVARLIEYIGAYYFRLQGVDTLVFTAGIGENSSDLKRMIAKELSFLEIKLKKQFKQGEDFYMTEPDSKFKIMVIPTNEEYQIFKETQRL